MEVNNVTSTSSIQTAPAPNEENISMATINVNEAMTVPSGVNSDFPPQETMYSMPPLTDPVDAWPQLDFDLSFPSFFESIMVPESNWVGAGEVQMPPDLTTVIPDYEEWPGSSDIFGFDFSTAFEQAMEPSQAISEPIDNHNNVLAIDGVVTNPLTDHARQRHDIFKKSPW